MTVQVLRIEHKESGYGPFIGRGRHMGWYVLDAWEDMPGPFNDGIDDLDEEEIKKGKWRFGLDIQLHIESLDYFSERDWDKMRECGFVMRTYAVDKASVVYGRSQVAFDIHGAVLVSEEAIIA